MRRVPAMQECNEEVWIYQQEKQNMNGDNKFKHSGQTVWYEISIFCDDRYSPLPAVLFIYLFSFDVNSISLRRRRQRSQALKYFFSSFSLHAVFCILLLMRLWLPKWRKHIKFWSYDCHWEYQRNEGEVEDGAENKIDIRSKSLNLTFDSVSSFGRETICHHVTIGILSLHKSQMLHLVHAKTFVYLCRSKVDI